MKKFELKGLDHIVLRVKDLNESIHFYVNIMGCAIAKTNDQYAMVHLSAGNSMIDIIDLKGPLGLEGGDGPNLEGRNVDHFCLRIDPFIEEDLIQYFQTMGMNVEKAQTRYGAEGYGQSIYVYDPDGNRVELKGPSLNP